MSESYYTDIYSTQKPNHNSYTFICILMTNNFNTKYPSWVIIYEAMKIMFLCELELREVNKYTYK